MIAGGRRDVDMTEGNIIRHLVMFALPLLIGNIFQQLYNTVDTWVVGNYVSNEAFSAVGTVGPVINTLIGFFTGLSSGAGAVISQYYGAKKYDKVSEAVHTSIVMTLVLGVVFTAVGVLITPAMLGFMKTPAEVMPESRAYLTIYFSGVIGLMIYNIGAGILRAVGDSSRPFYFLVVFITLLRTDTCIKLIPKKLRVNFEVLGKIVGIGIPAALQLAVTSFSNVFVQSYINYFGPDCMSGWTAYSKIDQLALLPMQSLSLAATTFVAQNVGKNDEARAKKGATSAVLMSIVITVVLMIPVMIFAPPLVAFFNDKPEVVSYGTTILRLQSPFYVLCCVNQIYAGVLRGSGKSRVPMVTMLFSFVVFRQIYLYIMANYISNEIIPIALAYPAGWLMASILITIYYKNTKLTKGRVTA